MKRKLKGHASFVNGVDASKKNDNLIVSCSDDGTCKVFLIPTVNCSCRMSVLMSASKLFLTRFKSQVVVSTKTQHKSLQEVWMESFVCMR